MFGTACWARSPVAERRWPAVGRRSLGGEPRWPVLGLRQLRLQGVQLLLHRVDLLLQLGLIGEGGRGNQDGRPNHRSSQQ